MLFRSFAPFEVLIASYTLLQQERKLLASVRWQTIVLDEAQAIKNAATKRSQAAMQLNGAFRLITTGTPIENHLGELWNLFAFINPGLLGTFKQFNRRFGYLVCFSFPLLNHNNYQQLLVFLSYYPNLSSINLASFLASTSNSS